MELKWLEDFVSLANTGSFSKAAEIRHISQSAFSRRIMALEDWLGVEVVDRQTYPVSLTDAGAQLIGIANRVIRTIYQTREDFGYREGSRSRTLTLGAADYLAVHFVPSWLQAQKALLGERKIQVRTGLKAGLGFVELLKTEELDFLLAYGGSVNRDDHDSGLFESLILDQDLLVPVGKTSLFSKFKGQFPKAHNKPIPYVSYMPGSAMSKKINRVTARHSSLVNLQTIVETGTADAIKALVLSGFGMAWLPRISVREELRTGLLCELGDERHQIPFSIELFRFTANTKSEVILFWDKLLAQF